MIFAAPDRQLGLLQHALGLSADRRVPYRNYFVAGESHQDYPDLLELERMGYLARTRVPAFLEEGDIVFAATDAGKTLAISSLPSPSKRSHYDDYLAADSGKTFGEFLCGVHIPKFEDDRMHRRYGEPVRFRMYRETWNGWRWHRDVQGEWAPYKKDAKASYKAALAEHKGKERLMEAASQALASPSTHYKSEVPGNQGVQADASELDLERTYQ